MSASAQPDGFVTLLCVDAAVVRDDILIVHKTDAVPGPGKTTHPPATHTCIHPTCYLDVHAFGETRLVTTSLT